MSRFRTALDRGLTSLCEIVSGSPLWVLFWGILLAIFSSYYAYRHLTFLPNFAGLNKDDVSYSRNYAAFVKEFNVQPDIVIVAKGPRPDENIRFLDALARRLFGKPYLQRTYYKIELKPFKSWALAYADPPTLRKIASTVRLAKPFFDTIDDQADLTRFWTAIPKMSGKRTNFQTDASQINQLTQFVDIMNEKVEGKTPRPFMLATPFKDFQNVQETQYITLRGGTYALFFARPAADPPPDLAEAVKDIRKEIASLLTLFPNVEAHLTGEPVLGADEMETAKHDIFWAGLVSLVACSAILIVGFGDIRKTIVTVIALVIGIGWSIAYIALLVGHLNVFTLSLFPMLIGLAIDFSIQFLGRYLEERARPRSSSEAILTTYFKTGSGLFAAALITSLGFFAISFTQYKGIAELGVATGGSLILCFISTMTILPALLAWIERNETAKTSSVAFFTVEGALIERYLLSHFKMVLFIGFLLTALFAIKARHIAFDHNVLNLQAKSTDSIKTELELLQVSGKSSLFAVMVAEDPKQAEEYSNQLQHLDSVGSVQSPLPYVPQDQSKKSSLLLEIKNSIDDLQIRKATQPVQVPLLISAFEKINQMIKDGQKKLTVASGALELLQSFLFPGSNVIPHRSLTARLADMNLALERLQRSVSRLLALLKTTDPKKASELLTQLQSQLYKNLKEGFDFVRNGIPARAITLSDLPPEVRNQFVGKSGKILLEVFPSQNIWNRPALERFISQLREVDPNVTGSPVLIMETTRLMLESYKSAAKLALGVIVLVTFFQFRRIRLTLLALIPLGIGLLWLMGIMVVFHRAFNPANLLTLPIILGIGVAFGVYVVNRYREEKHPSIFSTSTGRSVLLSALTSIAGFASLLGVSHQGLQSLGFTMTVGLSAITLQALVVLPALLEAVESYKGKRREKSLSSFLYRGE